jgi:hypothetical protein
VDFQLLFELRVSLIQGKPLPLPLLRVMRERGWVALPPPEEWVHVRAAHEGATQKTIEAFSYDLAVPRITLLGEREIALHARAFDDADIEALLVEEMEVDEQDCEDEDGDY